VENVVPEPQAAVLCGTLCTAVLAFVRRGRS
jgi:hypothetical protein